MAAVRLGGKLMRQTSKSFALLVLLAAFGLAPALFAQHFSPVEAKLVIPDTKTLPGVPFDLWIEVRNQSDASVAVGLFPRLIVRPEHGDVFEITPERNDVPNLLGGSEASYLVISPGITQVLT